jgi:hypothetical protein
LWNQKHKKGKYTLVINDVIHNILLQNDQIRQYARKING